MILEGVITSVNSDGGGHVTPMGFRRDEHGVIIAPFVPSTTLDNLARAGTAAINLTDDVCIIAGCLTGRREWPLVPTTAIRGWRLTVCLAHLELEVERQDADRERPRFHCRVVHEANHAPFRGFNRAQAAVVEAAILVSRLDFIAPEKLAAEITYLNIAIAKTAGPRERTAWQWLLAAIAAHPRHALKIESMS